MIGYMKKDKLVINSSIKRVLFIKDDPMSSPSEQIFKVARKLAKISERKVLEEEKGVTRFFRKIFSGF